MPVSNPLFDTSVIIRIIAGQLLLLLVAAPAVFFAYRERSSAWGAAAVAAFGGWLAETLSAIWCEYEVAAMVLDLMRNPELAEDMSRAAALSSGPLTPCFNAAGESFVLAVVLTFSVVAVFVSRVVWIDGLGVLGAAWRLLWVALLLVALAFPFVNRLRAKTVVEGGGWR